MPSSLIVAVPTTFVPPVGVAVSVNVSPLSGTVSSTIGVRTSRLVVSPAPVPLLVIVPALFTETVDNVVVPRRPQTNVLWIGNSFGSSLARIDTRTMETRIVPFPDPTMQPYHITVDSKHNVWGNLWTSDRIIKFNPTNNAWTVFDLPVRGTEIRHISLLEQGDKLSVVMPVYRTSQMGVMTVRSEAELAALKARAR